jgi:predicted Zn-dependent peptidase
VTSEELAKAKNQLRARLVFEDDGVTSLAHQLGYYETVASVELYADLPRLIAAVTEEDVARVARQFLRSDKRTVGWFEPAVSSFNGAGPHPRVAHFVRSLNGAGGLLWRPRDGARTDFSRSSS